MMIENVNNIQNNNNNFWFSIPINTQKLKYIIKNLAFFSFVFITISLITLKLYINNNSITHMKNSRDLYYKNSYLSDNSLDFKRELDTKNNNFNNTQYIMERMNNDYSFIINLTSNEYMGNWTDLSIKNENFFNSKINNGVAEIYFHKINFSLLLFPDFRQNSFKIDTIIKEGKYIDKYIKINLTFNIEKNIENYLNEDETYILTNNNTPLEFNKVQFSIGKKKEKVDKANVILKISKEELTHSPSFRKNNFSPLYNVKMIIISKEINVTIDSKISNTENLNQEVRLYSFILSILGIMEIYYCSKLIIKITNQNEIAHKISLISLAINCCFNLVICIIHFYMSVKIIDEDISYQFGIITIIYFFCFMGFELKLLLLVFRLKNEGGGNMNIYRRRLLSVYLMFYIGFSFIVFNIKECITNFYLILIVYTLSWLSQILLSICQNSRPPMSRLYLIWLSLSRLVFPIYIKGFDNNFFNLRPSYFKVSLLILIILIEMVILILQKSLGPRIIIPKKFRKQNQAFDYYKDKVNIEKHISHNPICVICLENLENDIDDNLNKIKKKKKPKTLVSELMNILYLNALNAKIKKAINYLIGKNLKKKYMITPCDHVYHSVCLEKWMKHKNECPYCRTKIPPIDS